MKNKFIRTVSKLWEGYFRENKRKDTSKKMSKRCGTNHYHKPRIHC